MSPREPQRTPPKTLAMQSSRDMLEKLRREIDRLAGSIIRQDIVDHGLNAAMTAWHLTDWAWREIEGSTRRPTLTARAGAPIRELKQFQELVKRNCAELAYCEDIAISTKHFTFSKLPVFSTKVTERFKINPIGKDGGATRHQFSPTGETVTYTAQAAGLWNCRWKVTNTGHRSPGTRVPMVVQIHQRNVDVVKPMLPYGQLTHYNAQLTHLRISPE